MDTEDTKTKPVIITDGKSNSKMFFKMVCIGLGIAVLIGIGTYAKTLSTSIFSGTETAAVGSDAEMRAQCDQLIDSGKLAEARDLLEKNEAATGLTPEMSDKLDEVYMYQAKQLSDKGEKKEAIELLKKVPTESSRYVSAQAIIKNLTAVPKAEKKISSKSHSSGHKAKHHK